MIKRLRDKLFPPPCECGNPKPCDGSMGFIVLYDVVDNKPFSGRFVLNYERAKRCKHFELLK